MSYFGSTDYLIEVAKGNIEGHSLIQKFGAATGLGANYIPVCISKTYNTPQVGSAATLRVKAGNANDTAAGLGAREITIEGLDTSGNVQTASIATAGASASANFSGSWLRLYRAWVSSSGVYATTGGGSHAAAVIIQTSGGVDWATIDATNYAKGQSQIGCYPVPLGYTAFLLDYNLTVDSGKSVDFLCLSREGILDTAAPYSAMRTLFQEFGLSSPFRREYRDPLQINELSDIIVLAKGSGSPNVTVDLNILLVDNNYL